MTDLGQVLVTGATGFLGRAICSELDAQGYQVHALVRPSSDTHVLRGTRAKLVQGDLLDRDSLLRAAQGVAQSSPVGSALWLVHNAAALGYRRSDARVQQAVNVEGTEHVLDAACKAGFSRAVHVSSVVTVGHARSGLGVTEESVWNADRLPVEYVQTKRQAEQVALARCTELDVRVVNPGAIFGPGGEASNTGKLLSALASGQLGPVVPPGGMSVVGVSDTARGVRLTLERGRRGARYILADEFLCTRALCERATERMRARGLAVRVPKIAVHRALWSAVVSCVRLVECFHEPHLTTSRALRMVGLEWRVSSTRARTELGWRTTPFDQVLDETLDDLQSRGHLASA